MAQVQATPAFDANLTHAQHVTKTDELVKALLSTSYGTTRPPQIAVGGLWVGPSANAGDYILYVYDGTADQKLAESFYWPVYTPDPSMMGPPTVVNTRMWRTGNGAVQLEEGDNPGADYNFSAYLWNKINNPVAGKFTYTPQQGDMIYDTGNSGYRYYYDGAHRRFICENSLTEYANGSNWGAGTLYNPSTFREHTTGLMELELNPESMVDSIGGAVTNSSVDMTGPVEIRFKNSKSDEDRDPKWLGSGGYAPSALPAHEGNFVRTLTFIVNYTNSASSSFTFSGNTGTANNTVFKFINKIKTGATLTRAADATSDSIAIAAPTATAFPYKARVIKVTAYCNFPNKSPAPAAVLVVFEDEAEE